MLIYKLFGTIILR